MIRSLPWLLTISLSVASVVHFLHGQTKQACLFALAACVCITVWSLAPRLVRTYGPFRGAIAMAGLPSAYQALHDRDTRPDCGLLQYELELLRILNRERRVQGQCELTLYGPLLAEARACCSRSVNCWRLFSFGTCDRLPRQNSLRVGATVSSIRGRADPQKVIDGWMRKPRIRALLLMNDYDVGAVGIAVDKSTGRSCIIVLLGTLTR